MFETLRYESRRRVRGTAIMTAAISLYAGFTVWYFSALEGVDYEQLVQEAPATVKQAFGIESLTTIEGFLSAQVFNFVWLLGLGLYFAYAAGALIADDIESERMDLLLSFPISRTQLLAETFASLLVPLLAVNIVTGGVIYLLVGAIGQTIAPAHLVVAHVFSLPYLLVCAAIGVVASVLAERAAIAKRAAVGIVFALYLVESVVGSNTAFEWVQYISPTHYYKPTQILVHGSFNVTDPLVLLVTFVVLLALGQFLFQRRDI
ncbi:ABC transporter permease [Halovenus rubra]|uniref:ABC transporter permease n=2 Tax=Halovenus rubra TaxID=869890 RepID=A0ABD5X4P2_9EURY|nr:ABC transporter permease subunit [Halovenus rubra]